MAARKLPTDNMKAAANDTHTAVQIAFVDETEFATKKGGGRTRNTEYDGLVTQLHDTGKVAKLNGTEEDLKATINAMRGAAKHLFGMTVHVRIASDGATLVKLAKPNVRGPRKPKVDG